MQENFDREQFQSQELVFQWGDPGDSAYVIEEGCVEVLAGPRQAQRRIAMLTQGAMFGEVALLDRQPRTATVRALVPTKLVRIDRSHVEELLLRSDPVIQYLMRLLLARFRSTHTTTEPMGEPDSRATAEPGHDEAATQDLHRAAVRTLSLAQDLSDAIDRKQLALYYQPLIDFAGHRLVGFEALIRWKHPTLGLVNPDEFIPLAERTGLIHRIGHWVVHRALSDWAELRPHCVALNQERAFVSVNLSSPELVDGAVAQKIFDSLQQFAVDPSELRIELTETTVIDNMQAVSRTLERLRSVGVGIALDDFGTGYAGLDYLQALPFTCLKIDRTFVQQMHQSERSVHIVKAALALAQSIGLSTIAEGIETQAVGEQLAAMGCSHAQGFHYGKPMPKEDIGAWHLAHRAKFA